jgi:hypothetical protein
MQTQAEIVHILRGDEENRDIFKVLLHRMEILD